MSDYLTAAIMLLMWTHGFLTAWSIAHDGKSKFWTGYRDVSTLRIFWRRKP